MTTERKLPKTLTHDDFQLVADHCYHVTRKIVRKGKTVAAVVIAGTVGERGVNVKLSIGAPMEDDTDKYMVTQLTEALVQHPDIDFVAMVSEAWFVATKDKRDLEGSLADHPDRQEAVIFNILSKDCQIVVMNPLHRNPSRLTRGKLDFSVKFAGRMARDPETKN